MFFPLSSAKVTGEATQLTHLDFTLVFHLGTLFYLLFVLSFTIIVHNCYFLCCFRALCLAVLQVVTEQRLARQNKNPLTAEEFVVPLSKLEPIYR